MNSTSSVSRDKYLPATCAALLGALLLISIPSSANAAQPSSVAAEIAQANALGRAGKFAESAKILKHVTTREPKNAQAWHLLGTADLRSGDNDGALQSFTQALGIEPDSAPVMYNLGVVYARMQKPDTAFEWLGKAQATHKLDMTAIQTDADLASLQKDPRFAALLPPAADFAKPFVEDVKILGEWDGESINDQFGWIARDIGDVDGDAVHDFVTSAPTRNVSGENAGRVYVYSTRSRKLLWSVDGKPGDQLGTGVESAGDANHDGIPDVIAGAPGSDSAYVYSGMDGHVLLTLHGETAGDNFGNVVSSVGDANQDGYADVIVGAPSNNAGGKGAGRAYVYSGKDGHLLLTLTGEHAGDAFGSTATGYSDAKHTFIVVGAPGAGARKTGRIYVYDKLSSTPKFTFDSDETGKQLGYMFVSVPGDVDGDGVPDIFASDWANGANAPGTGRIYVYSGKTGKNLLTLTGQTAGEGFGTTHSIAGDVDGDGHADLIVGSWQYANAAVSGGRAYLYSGKDGKLLRTYTGRIPGETFGFDAVTLGDVDGDGTADFLIASAWSGVHGFHSGRIFLISSGMAHDAPKNSSP